MSDRWQTARYLLDIHAGYRLMHNHRLDPAYGGRTYMRLPDGARVPIEKYEARLQAYRAEQRRQREARQAGSSAPDG